MPEVGEGKSRVTVQVRWEERVWQRTFWRPFEDAQTVRAEDGQNLPYLSPVLLFNLYIFVYINAINTARSFRHVLRNNIQVRQFQIHITKIYNY